MKSFLGLSLLIAIALNVAAMSLRHSSTECAVTPHEVHPTSLPAQHASAAEIAKPARSPLLAAFDVDGDNVLSAAEIANAARVLRSLDANGDGVLTADEFPRP